MPLIYNIFALVRVVVVAVVDDDDNDDDDDDDNNFTALFTFSVQPLISLPLNFAGAGSESRYALRFLFLSNLFGVAIF